MTETLVTGPEVLTLREAADVLRISMRTAYLLVETTELPAVKVGGQWRILRRELDRFLSRAAQEGNRG